MAKEHDQRIIELVLDRVNSGLNNREIARDLSSVNKAELIGAIRLMAEEYVHEEDAEQLVTALEDLGEDAPTSRLRMTLDRLEKADVEKKDGDYHVVQKEVFKQVYLVPGEEADSHKDAARQFMSNDQSFSLYGTADYQRPLEEYMASAELEVAKVGEDFGTYVDPDDL